eukprot:7381796-Prymnesium_polylepis.1
MRRKPRFYLFTICAPMSYVPLLRHLIRPVCAAAHRVHCRPVVLQPSDGADHRIVQAHDRPAGTPRALCDPHRRLRTVLSTITIVSLHAIAMPVSHLSVDPQFYDMASHVFTFSTFSLLNAWFGYLVVHNAQAPIEVERIRRAAKRDSRDVRDAEQISKIHARAALIRKKQAMTLCSTAAVQPSAATASMTETASEMMQTYMSRSRAVLV